MARKRGYFTGPKTRRCYGRRIRNTEVAGKTRATDTKGWDAKGEAHTQGTAGNDTDRHGQPRGKPRTQRGKPRQYCESGSCSPELPARRWQFRAIFPFCLGNDGLGRAAPVAWREWAARVGAFWQLHPRLCPFCVACSPSTDALPAGRRRPQVLEASSFTASRPADRGRQASSRGRTYPGLAPMPPAARAYIGLALIFVLKLSDGE